MAEILYIDVILILKMPLGFCGCQKSGLAIKTALHGMLCPMPPAPGWSHRGLGGGLAHSGLIPSCLPPLPPFDPCPLPLPPYVLPACGGLWGLLPAPLVVFVGKTSANLALFSGRPPFFLFVPVGTVYRCVSES